VDTDIETDRLSATQVGNMLMCTKNHTT